MNRRHFLTSSATALAATSQTTAQSSGESPNILYLFSDQWRAMDHGYMGNPDVRTPNIDALADQSVNFTNAVSGIPVCCPHRGCLLTGQYPLSHGLFLNDLRLNDSATSLAEALTSAGYNTGYIGKWHIDGTGRSAYIPPERRQGFDYWKVLECTHNYNKSRYFDREGQGPRTWEGYDAYAQTRDAVTYIRNHGAATAENRKPFSLFLSWGPPPCSVPNWANQMAGALRPQETDSPGKCSRPDPQAGSVNLRWLLRSLQCSRRVCRVAHDRPQGNRATGEYYRRIHL